MKCLDCLHWVKPRSVDSLPDYPIGFCGIFQKDVAGEYDGCAGRYFLDRDRTQWRGSTHEIECPAQAPINLPAGAKIVSISEPITMTGTVTVVYFIPDEK